MWDDLLFFAIFAVMMLLWFGFLIWAGIRLVLHFT